MASSYQCGTCLLTFKTLEAIVSHPCRGSPDDSGEVPFVGENISDICTLAYQQAVMSDNSAACDPSQSTSESSNFVERWDDRQVRLLISCYSKLKHLFGKGKTTKKEVFAKIAMEFNSVSDQKVTAEQCIQKWYKLELKQKEVEDNNKQTGRARRSWKFHDDMTECLGSSPKINPGFTFDTSSSNSGSSGASQCDNDDETQDPSDESCNEDGPSKKKKAKLPTRKRKSNSSAAEMLQFLHSYSERREKAEAEKLALFKSMQDEKKEFCSQFLDLLKKK